MKHKILKIDPNLKAFEKDFDLRMENYRRKKAELLAPGQTLNEFAKNHSDIIKNVEELPELTDDIANVYLYELDRYTQEIRKWEQKALENAANKEQEYIQADDALLKTRIDFYKSNYFKLERILSSSWILPQDF